MDLDVFAKLRNSLLDKRFLQIFESFFHLPKKGIDLLQKYFSDAVCVNSCLLFPVPRSLFPTSARSLIFTFLATSHCAMNSPATREEILLPPRYGEGWGGVSRIDANKSINYPLLAVVFLESPSATPTDRDETASARGSAASSNPPQR